jgi:hypothetical protein
MSGGGVGGGVLCFTESYQATRPTPLLKNEALQEIVESKNSNGKFII